MHRPGDVTSQRTQDVLYESEAALRMVDQQLDQLQEEQGEYRALLHYATPSVTSALLDVPHVLQQANVQINAVLTRLRDGRAAIESTASNQVMLTHEKLRQVHSATEDAATNILDACDRASSLVDQLDAIDVEHDREREREHDREREADAPAVGVRNALRDELCLMMTALQFQDITSQQLAHASAVLVEMEERLMTLARLFDIDDTPETLGADVAGDYHDSAFDPNATVSAPEARQALADEIFTAIRVPAA